MASEIKSVLATIPGLVEEIQGAGTGFSLASNLFNAVGVKVQAINAGIGQLPYYPQPAVKTVQTETTAVSVSAITIGSRQMTPASYWSATNVSLLALQAGNGIPAHLKQIMINDVAATVDSVIADVATRTNFSSLTPIANVTTGEAFRSGVKALRQTGVPGKIKAWLTEYQIDAICSSEKTFFNPAFNDRIVSNGYAGVTSLAGVEVYKIPSDWAPTDTTSGFKNGLMWIDTHGLGLTYHPNVQNVNGDIVDLGLMHLDFAKPYIGAEDMGVGVMIAVSEVSSYGGVLLLSDNASE